MHSHLVNFFLFIVLVSVSFFLNYISALYSEFDLFKVDLTKELKQKKNDKLSFVIKNGNLLFAINYFVQVIINWFISISLIEKLEKELFENSRFGQKTFLFLISILIAFLTEILSRWLAASELSKELATKKFFVNISYGFTKPFSFLQALIKPNRKIFINSESDIIRFINNLTVENILEKEEAKLIQSALNFDELIVNSFFTPWHKVVFLESEMNLEEIKNIHEKNFLTRYPVLNCYDDIVGIFNMKVFDWERIKWEKRGRERDMDWRNCIEKKIVFLSPYDALDKAFEKISSSNCRLAIVKERNKILGVITLQDILVSLVGKMTDEKDKLLPIKVN